jgi:hypothetical protein
LLYIAFAAVMVRKWTSAINQAVALPFAIALVGLNALVFMAPLFTLASEVTSAEPYLLAGGAYVGLLIAAFFLRGYVIRRPEVLADQTLVLFIGLSLLLTYVEVQLWVFGYLRVMPEPSLYALLFTLAGYLVLSLEKELTSLRDDSKKKEASFVGFGLLGLSILLGLSDPYVRVLVLCAAGLVWLNDAWRRPTVVAHWIGLTLFTLGVASTVLFGWFPNTSAGTFVIALALMQLGFAWFARARSEDVLRRAATDMHATLLFLAAIVVMGGQWHFHGNALRTAAELFVIAGLLFVSGERTGGDRGLGYVYTGAFLVAFALPYLGCVDLDTLSLEGNLMPFGLGLASLGWIALVQVVKAPLLVRARSTTLAFYGALAVAAMLVRLTAERDADSAASSLYLAAELIGPISMALIMVAATYFSRSWIPAAMAGLIVVVLVPDLKAALHIGKPTGLGSATTALGLLAAAFYLRRAPFLRELPAGDAWLFGEKFPFARHDHTLFTAPLVLTTIILALRVDSYTVMLNAKDPSALFLAALAITVVAHTLTGVYLGVERRGRSFVYLAPAVLYMCLSFAQAERWPWRPLDVLVATGLFVHAAYVGYTRGFLSKLEWVRPLLADPMRAIMAHGSLLAALLVVSLLVIGLHPLYAAALLAFCLYQVVWHGHARGELRYGAMLFSLVLAGALAFSDPSVLAAAGSSLRPLFERLDYYHAFPAALAVAAAVHVVVLLVCEALPPIHARWYALITPSHVGATGLVLLLCLAASIGGVTHALNAEAVWLLGAAFALGVVVARAERSVPIALFVFLCVLAVPLSSAWPPAPIFASAAVLLIALTAAVKIVHAKNERVIAGAFPLPFVSFTNAAPAHLLALALCAVGEMILLGNFAERGRLPIESLVCGFVFASCVGLVARAWQKPVLHYGGWAALAFANVLVALVHLRAPLVHAGLSDGHVVAVGLGVTLLVSSGLSYLARDPAMTRTAERTSTLLATAIIALLTLQYLVHPNLGAMSSARFAISGVAAYLAALYLRLAAKRDPGAYWITALYHFGVTMALWCAALILPPLRAPGVALVALGVPLLYFYARAELAGSPNERRQYADSATALSFVVLFVYTLRFAVQLVLFSDVPVDHGYYHTNAPAMIVLGLIMFRLHALRLNSWLATYGGLTLMLGSFFLATWPARVSPFAHLGTAALVAMALAHFWIAFAAYRSPLRAGLMRLGDITIEQWPSHARVWSVTLLVSVHVLALMALGSNDPRFTPMLLALVSVVWHLASGWRSPYLFTIGGIELLTALHAEVFGMDGVPKALIVWSVLACFAVMLAGRRVLAFLFDFTALGRSAAVFCILTMGHVLFHGPKTPVGLFAVLLLAILSAATPYRRGFRTELPLAELILLGAVPWLVFFSQLKDDPVAPWPLHAVATALLLIAAIARWLHDAGKPPAMERLGAAVVAFLNERYQGVQVALGGAALFMLLFVRYVTWKTPLPFAEVGLVCVLYAGVGYGAWGKARAQRIGLLFLLTEYCLEQIFESVRFEVVLTNAAAWTPHYDIIAMLVASLALAAVKELIDLEREAMLPVAGTLIGLPVAALTWTVWNGLSLDVALFVIGINSLIFAFMGRNQKESPYNVLAIFGFIAFILAVFKGKLELTELHAYVVPVGVGILALVHLYERVLERSTRANIRLITLGAMLASAGYHALLDDRFPLAFHATFILLSVMMMAVGATMRVKLYLVIGFFGALLDAVVLLVKAVAYMDRGPRMTLIGAFVLLTGALLVGGAIYYKAHKDALLERYGRVRSRFAGWE